MTRPSVVFTLGLFLAAWLVQCALYAHTFQVQPAGDDWGPPMTDIFVGNEDGIGTLVGETRQAKNYRPGQSLLMWMAGRAAGVDGASADAMSELRQPATWFSIRALTLLSSGVFIAATALLVMQMPIGRAGVIASAVVLTVHPSLAAAIASIDGFTSVLAPAFVMLAAAAVVRFRNTPALGLAAMLACLVVGTLFKEYAFAVVPVSALAALLFSAKAPWRWAILHAVTGAVVVAALLYVRRFVIPDELATTGGGLPTIKNVAFNFALTIVGGLFSGNTVFVMATKSPAALAWVGVTVLANLVLLGVGLWKLLRRRDDDTPTTDRAASVKRWVIFAALGIFTASFPANVVLRMSEMYLAAWVGHLALLAGLCVVGWQHVGPTPRRLAVGVATVIALVAAASTWVKADGVRASGFRAANAADSILGHIDDAEATGQNITIYFALDTLPPNRTYSVFRVGDDVLLGSAGAIPHLRQGTSVTSEVVHVETEDAARDRAAFNTDRLDILWDPPTQTFRRLD